MDISDGQMYSRVAIAYHQNHSFCISNHCFTLKINVISLIHTRSVSLQELSTLIVL